MLAVRIMPCLDIKNGRVVKGVNFEGLRDAGDPLAQAEKYNDSGADELVFLDITATNEKRGTVIELATKLARRIFIPFTIGGGVSSCEQATKLVQAGADKIGINSAAVANPSLISECAESLGSQCVVIAIDVKKIDGEYLVFTKAGTHNTGINAEKWAMEVRDKGAGEILLTSMDRDGTNTGFDIEITKRISEKVNIPVIASGGGGTPEHFADAVTTGKADALLGAGLFHFNKYTINQVKTHLADRNIPVRLTQQCDVNQ